MRIIKTVLIPYFYTHTLRTCRVSASESSLMACDFASALANKAFASPVIQTQSTVKTHTQFDDDDRCSLLSYCTSHTAWTAPAALLICSAFCPSEARICARLRPSATLIAASLVPSDSRTVALFFRSASTCAGVTHPYHSIPFGCEWKG